MLSIDRNRLEEECSKLRQQVIDTMAQVIQYGALLTDFNGHNVKVAGEKERSAVRLQEERERAERELHSALAESVKNQSQLKAELASIVQRVKVSIVSTYLHSRLQFAVMQADEYKKEGELEMRLAKHKESIMSAHALEIEKINEKHRLEIKRQQVISCSFSLLAIEMNT